MKTSHVTVYSVKEAWSKANSLFPCDYMHDSKRSRNAGYDVYFSTCDSIIAWISDLGNRLEVNLSNGDTVEIWIEEKPEPVEILEVVAEKTAENEYTVTVSNGETITVKTDVEYNGVIWPWKVGSQMFSKEQYAARYLRRRMEELVTGIRYLPRKHDIPCICGVNGSACRNKNCNSALCSFCPIAEKHYADKDGVKIVYLQ